MHNEPSGKTFLLRFVLVRAHSFRKRGERFTRRTSHQLKLQVESRRRGAPTRGYEAAKAVSLRKDNSHPVEESQSANACVQHRSLPG
jgi:hypothetical protein